MLRKYLGLNIDLHRIFLKSKQAFDSIDRNILYNIMFDLESFARMTLIYGKQQSREKENEHTKSTTNSLPSRNFLNP